MSIDISTASATDRKIAPLPRNLGLALIVIAAAQLMVVLDATIVNIALPSIQRALQFSATDLEWVINAYALTFGGLLLLGGRAGGVLTSFASWRWVLFVNVPIGILLAIVAPRVLAPSKGRDGGLDLPGALTATGGMVLLVYGLSRAATYGWTDTMTLTALGLAGV